MDLRPYQIQGIEEVERLMREGENRICVYAPTGAGKTRMMMELMLRYPRSILYTHRTMLREQTSRVMDYFGIDYGTRAAGEKPRLLADTQIASIQTEIRRVAKQGRWRLHQADIANVDEAHLQLGDQSYELISRHLESGTKIIGWSATPLNLRGAYDHLVKVSDVETLISQGYLVPYVHYGPNEPSPSSIKSQEDGTISDKEVERVCKKAMVYANVLEHYQQLNPEQRPTVLFACSVETSLWWAQHFTAHGIKAAHIDGEHVWYDGKWLDSTHEVRDDIRRLTEKGIIKVVTNRFVLREGIDWPFLSHAIFATIFGSLTSYLQAGGRMMRPSPGKALWTCQDHGGNWWRHGSLSVNRDWSLGDTTRSVQKTRERRMRERKDPDPIMCPRCFAIRLSGRKCDECGYEHRTRSRFVVQEDGELAEVEGNIHAPRRQSRDIPKYVRDWVGCYHRGFKSGKSFAATEALYAKEHYWKWPRTDWPYMPKFDSDWYRLVQDVHPSRLVGWKEGKIKPSQQC